MRGYPIGRSDQLIAGLMTQPKSIREYLPYDEYLDAFRIFVNHDGSLGALYEVLLCEHETKSAREIAELVQSLEKWLIFDERTVVQFMWDQVEMRADGLLAEGGSDGNNGILDFLHSTRRMQMTSVPELVPMKRRLRIAVRRLAPPRAAWMAGMAARAKMRISRAAESIVSSHSTLGREAESLLSEIRAFEHDLTRMELSSPLPITRLDGTALIGWLRERFFPPRHPEDWPAIRAWPWNPQIPISWQVLARTLSLDHAGITRNGRKSRVISLKNPPATAYPGAMTYLLGLPFEVEVSVHFSFPSTALIKRHFGIKEFFLQNTPSAQARRQRGEVESLQDRIAAGDRVVQMTFLVTVQGMTEEELDAKTHRVLAIFRDRLESEAIVEDTIGTGLWMTTLPFGYLPTVDYTSRRAIRILRSDAVHFLPVFDSFRGLPGKPQSIFLSRERNLVGFSLRAIGNSHHTAVIGDTGSAKSGLVISLLLAEMRRDPRPLVFVIDRKTSYGVVARVVPSHLTTFERSQAMPFSPFSEEGGARGDALDEGKLAFLVHLLTTAMKLTSADFAIDSEHKTCLSEAIRRAYATCRRSERVRYEEGALVEGSANPARALVTLDDVIAELSALTATPEFESYGPEIEEIAKKLRPFYGDGIYAPFFGRRLEPSCRDQEEAEKGAKRGGRKDRNGARGETDASGQVKTSEGAVANEEDGAADRAGTGRDFCELRDLYVYDLDALSGDPILQTLVTMGVVDEIRRTIQNPEAARRGGFIVIEELGLLGRDNPVAKDFVIEAAETFRKLGFFLIGLTPNPKNYFDLAVGQAMWSVADHYLFLMTKPDNVEAIAKNSDLLDEAGVEIVKSLRTVPGKHAEVFYTHKTKSVSGAFLNEPGAFELWLMPTHAPDHRAAMQALAKFPDEPARAISWLAEKYPAGTTEVGK